MPNRGVRVQHTRCGPSNALITAHATSHQAPSRATQAAAVEKVTPRAQQKTGSTLSPYYVKATRLAGTDRIIQLLECCDDQLRKDLTKNTLTEMTKAMKRLAVRVARGDMSQCVRMELDSEDKVTQQCTTPTPRPYWRMYCAKA